MPRGATQPEYRDQICVDCRVEDRVRVKTTSPDASRIPPVSKKTMLMVALLFSVGLINYLDRQTLSILKATLKTVFGFTDSDYSLLITAFLLPYIVMYVLSGRLVDKFGTRFSMSLFVVSWSIANALTGLVQSFNQLAGARFLLGVAEPGAFPAMQRAIVTWVPAKRRAFIMGLISTSTTVGAMIAPPAVALMTLHLGWRGAFILPAILGLIVGIVWWFSDRDPPAQDDGSAPPELAPIPMRTVLRDQKLWGIIVARGISDPVLYFHLFWMPGYLQERLGLSLADLGKVGWIPSFTASAFIIMAGRWTDRRILAGADPVRTRLIVFVLGAVLAPLGALTTFAPNLFVAMMLITIVTVAAQLWFFGTGVLLAEIFPARVNATAFGVIGAFGASAGLVMNFVAGPIIERFGYPTVFIFIACLHPLAAIVLRTAVLRGHSTLAENPA
jgi:MFS transporter, ACS family, hexuronate transporter